MNSISTNLHITEIKGIIILLIYFFLVSQQGSSVDQRVCIVSVSKHNDTLLNNWRNSVMQHWIASHRDVALIRVCIYYSACVPASPDQCLACIGSYLMDDRINYYNFFFLLIILQSHYTVYYYKKQLNKYFQPCCRSNPTFCKAAWVRRRTLRMDTWMTAGELH